MLEHMSDSPSTVASSLLSVIETVGDPIEMEKTLLLPPVDGGRRAWIFLFGGFMVEGLLYGFLTSFGIFLRYYQSNPEFGTSPFLPAIGTLALGISKLGAPFITPFIIRYPGHRKYMIWSGWIICLVSLIGSASASKLWHLILGQGLGYGIGFLCVYYPLLNMLDEWWVERRAFAYGIMFGTGGIIYTIIPIVLEKSLSLIGGGWTLLAYSGGIFITIGPTLPFLQGRTNSQPYPSVARGFDSTVLPQVSFASISFANFFQGLVCYLPPFFIPAYASAIGLSTTDGVIILTAINITTVLSQFGIGSLADSTNPLILMFISSLGSGFVTFILWGFSSNIVSLLAFGILFGTFTGGYSVLYSRFATFLTNDQPTQTWLYNIFEAQRGLMIILGGIASSTLVQAAKASNNNGTGGYERLILFIGMSFAISSIGGVGWFFRRKSFHIPFRLSLAWGKPVPHSSPPPMAQEVLSSFRKLIDQDLEQGTLQHNYDVHERYLHALRGTFEGGDSASDSSDGQQVPTRGRGREYRTPNELDISQHGLLSESTIGLSFDPEMSSASTVVSSSAPGSPDARPEEIYQAPTSAMHTTHYEPHNNFDSSPAELYTPFPANKFSGFSVQVADLGLGVERTTDEFFGFGIDYQDENRNGLEYSALPECMPEIFISRGRENISDRSSMPSDEDEELLLGGSKASNRGDDKGRALLTFIKRG